MVRRPPRSTRTDTLFPSTTLFRSARLTRHTDPAFLHYRSGGFMAERFRKLPGMDPVMDSALSFAASKDDPASGGRHKVWGSKLLRSEEHTSELQSLMRISYAVFCLKKKR